MTRFILVAARVCAAPFGETWPKRTARIAVLSTAVLASIGAAQTATAHALSKTSGVAQARFSYKDDLKTPYKFKLKGKKKVDGSCAFSPPDLLLAPNERAIEARQVSVDYVACETEIEVGEPQNPSPASNEPAAGSTRQGNAQGIQGGLAPGLQTPWTTSPGPNSRRPANCVRPQAVFRGRKSTARVRLFAGLKGLRALAPRSVRRERAALMNLAARPNCGGGTIDSAGHYELKWFDILNFQLNETQSNLRWWWNGGCTTGANGSWYRWWQTWTGWNDYPRSAWLDGGCDYRTTHHYSMFWNRAFCGGNYEVNTWIDNARIHGFYNGYMSGGVDATWHTHSCAPLHWSHGLHRDH